MAHSVRVGSKNESPKVIWSIIARNTPHIKVRLDHFFLIYHDIPQISYFSWKQMYGLLEITLQTSSKTFALFLVQKAVTSEAEKHNLIHVYSLIGHDWDVYRFLQLEYLPMLLFRARLHDQISLSSMTFQFLALWYAWMRRRRGVGLKHGQAEEGDMPLAVPQSFQVVDGSPKIYKRILAAVRWTQRC